MDVFRTRKVEFDYSLDDVKSLYANLKIQGGNDFDSTWPPRWDNFRRTDSLKLIKHPERVSQSVQQPLGVNWLAKTIPNISLPEFTAIAFSLLSSSTSGSGTQKRSLPANPCSSIAPSHSVAKYK